MARASITSKRQLTLPKEVCDKVGLKPGEKLACFVRGVDEIVLRREKTRALDLVGLLPPPKRRLSLEEIDAVIGTATVEKVRRSSSRSR